MQFSQSDIEAYKLLSGHFPDKFPMLLEEREIPERLRKPTYGSKWKIDRYSVSKKDLGSKMNELSPRFNTYTTCEISYDVAKGCRISLRYLDHDYDFDRQMNAYKDREKEINDTRRLNKEIRSNNTSLLVSAKKNHLDYFRAAVEAVKTERKTKFLKILVEHLTEKLQFLKHPTRI